MVIGPQLALSASKAAWLVDRAILIATDVWLAPTFARIQLQAKAAKLPGTRVRVGEDSITVPLLAELGALYLFWYSAKQGSPLMEKPGALAGAAAPSGRKGLAAEVSQLHSHSGASSGSGDGSG